MRLGRHSRRGDRSTVVSTTRQHYPLCWAVQRVKGSSLPRATCNHVSASWFVTTAQYVLYFSMRCTKAFQSSRKTLSARNLLTHVFLRAYLPLKRHHGHPVNARISGIILSYVILPRLDRSSPPDSCTREHGSPPYITYRQLRRRYRKLHVLLTDFSSLLQEGSGVCRFLNSRPDVTCEKAPPRASSSSAGLGHLVEDHSVVRPFEPLFHRGTARAPLSAARRSPTERRPNARFARSARARGCPCLWDSVSHSVFIPQQAPPARACAHFPPF